MEKELFIKLSKWLSGRKSKKETINEGTLPPQKMLGITKMIIKKTTKHIKSNQYI